MLLLAASLVACTKKDEAKTVTLQAKWRHEKDHITEYNLQHQVVRTTDLTAPDLDYWDFKSNGTFELQQNSSVYISGTYVRTGQILDFTLTYQRNSTLPATKRDSILALTADRLVLGGKQHFATGYIVSEAYLTR